MRQKEPERAKTKTDFERDTKRVGGGHKFQKTETDPHTRMRKRGEIEKGRKKNGARGTERQRSCGGDAERAGREERMGDKEEWPFISPPKLIEATSA